MTPGLKKTKMTFFDVVKRLNPFKKNAQISTTAVTADVIGNNS
jgi:hypothetical protein